MKVGHGWVSLALHRQGVLARFFLKTFFAETPIHEIPEGPPTPSEIQRLVIARHLLGKQ
jgi:alkylation response protein AidB-like acyl-CoA dehydrogenase